ncbi:MULTISPECIES: TetR/AcrR family transcriptional regulator [unclassified Sphingopyxis]|uniref:TetR/AcrR family transcriptional regulator n=1 Tax=unclassified Sphingopyxis TaxID=2614943 RepID=UPI002864F28D|nr:MULTISPECIES: TetR/AcrR family transcriptional regulator [unclassified Sphingopyxis]MDR6832439.1 AcrR family transcriptional regulator [Sphingopyxis sp. BE122]MDR7228182.1 AcrR family transcriptional regulator [Sphingopyxis sp. BE259]
MARTQAPDYEERKEAVLDKAAELFARAGFHATSISELAKACDYSKSLIYYYYPSKEDILFAVMESHIDLLLADVDAVVLDDLSAADSLSALIRRFMQHYVGAASRQKVLLNELESLPESRRSSIVKKQRRIINAVQKLLVECEPELADNRSRARVKTMLLFGMINWTHTWFDPTGPVSHDDISKMVNDLITGQKGRSRTS